MDMDSKEKTLHLVAVTEIYITFVGLVRAYFRSGRPYHLILARLRILRRMVCDLQFLCRHNQCNLSSMLEVRSQTPRSEMLIGTQATGKQGQGTFTFIQ